MKNADLHCHPGLKPTYNKGYDNDKGDLWKLYPARKEINKLNALLAGEIRKMSRASQTNLESCVDGNVQLVCLSVYPFERPFFNVRNTFIRWFLLSKRNYKNLGAAAVGIPPEEITKFLEEYKSGVNYYNDYQQETKVIFSSANATSTNDAYAGKSFEMVADYEQYKALSEDPNKIIGILTMEGAHGFGNYSFPYPFKYAITDSRFEKEQITPLLQSFVTNINEVKSNTNTAKIPFFVTFTHHFNNLLAGHAPSFSGNMAKIFDQTTFMEQGFSEVGKEVLRLLLSRENGRRILIDAKHMSVKSRKEYYHALETTYANDAVPVIHSHASVSGIYSLKDAENLTVKQTDKLSKRHFFSKGTIGMTDEDILVTFKSCGIIGVCLHEGRMPGSKFKIEKNKIERLYKRKHLTQRERYNQIKNLFLKLFCSTVLHIVGVQKMVLDNPEFYRKPALCSDDPWSGITIGSDYDGIVDAFDTVSTFRDYTGLRRDIEAYFNKSLQGKVTMLNPYNSDRLSQDRIAELLNYGGKTVHQRVEQLMMGNLDAFLSKYFTDQYLNHNQS